MPSSLDTDESDRHPASPLTVNRGQPAPDQKLDDDLKDLLTQRKLESIIPKMAEIGLTSYSLFANAFSAPKDVLAYARDDLKLPTLGRQAAFRMAWQDVVTEEKKRDPSYIHWWLEAAAGLVPDASIMIGFAGASISAVALEFVPDKISLYVGCGAFLCVWLYLALLDKRCVGQDGCSEAVSRLTRWVLLYAALGACGRAGQAFEEVLPKAKDLLTRALWPLGSIAIAKLAVSALKLDESLPKSLSWCKKSMRQFSLAFTLCLLCAGIGAKAWQSGSSADLQMEQIQFF